MEKLECKSCGNSLKETDMTCPYCGTSNPAYKKNESNVVRSMNDLFGSSSNNTNSSSSNEQNRGSELNVCVLILLIIIFWPAAIVYAILKSKR